MSNSSDLRDQQSTDSDGASRQQIVATAQLAWLRLLAQNVVERVLAESAQRKQQPKSSNSHTG